MNMLRIERRKIKRDGILKDREKTKEGECLVDRKIWGKKQPLLDG